MHKQRGWPQAWDTIKQSRFKHLGKASQGVTEAGVSASRVTTLRHLQEKSYQATSEQNIVRSILPGIRRKRTGLLLSGSKSSFQMKVTFAFNLEIKVPESGGKWERHRIHVSWSPSVKFPQSSDDLGCHVICWCWSTVFSEVTVNADIYQEILEHFMRIYGVLSRGRWETPDPTMQMTWRPLSNQPGLPLHLSSAQAHCLHATHALMQ